MAKGIRFLDKIPSASEFAEVVGGLETNSKYLEDWRMRYKV